MAPHERVAHVMRLPQGQLAFASTEAQGFQVRFKFQSINADSFYYIFYFASFGGLAPSVVRASPALNCIIAGSSAPAPWVTFLCLPKEK
jgi:hypothetical protein